VLVLYQLNREIFDERVTNIFSYFGKSSVLFDDRINIRESGCAIFKSHCEMLSWIFRVVSTFLIIISIHSDS
jgi:hypothetical protein